MWTESLEPTSKILEQRGAIPLSEVSEKKNWVENASLLWDHRRIIFRNSCVAFVISMLIAISSPNEYVSKTKIMPPEQGSNSAAMLAALVGKASGAGGLAGLAGNLLGTKNSGALFIALLHSETVSGHLINQFDLQQVYRKRYREDTAKRLAHMT